MEREDIKDVGVVLGLKKKKNKTLKLMNLEIAFGRWPKKSNASCFGYGSFSIT